MSAFRKPASSRSVITVPPSAFADTWARRPTTPVKIGLRLISEDELTRAQKMAAQAVVELYKPDDPETPVAKALDLIVEGYNDHVVTNVLAQVLCDPDSGEPFFAPMPEPFIREALEPGGIRHLWDKYRALSVADGWLSPEATDEEIQSIPQLDMTKLDANAQLRVRKLCKAVLEEFE